MEAAHPVVHDKDTACVVVLFIDVRARLDQFNAGYSNCILFKVTWVCGWRYIS